MSCNCIKEMNAALAGHNARLGTAFQHTDDGKLVMKLLITTEKILPKMRARLPVVCASHCPFCGVSL